MRNKWLKSRKLQRAVDYQTNVTFADFETLIKGDSAPEARFLRYFYYFFTQKVFGFICTKISPT